LKSQSRTSAHQLSRAFGAVELDEAVDVDDLSSDVGVVGVGVTPADLLAEEDEGERRDHAAVVNVDRRALHDLVENLEDKYLDLFDEEFLEIESWGCGYLKVQFNDVLFQCANSGQYCKGSNIWD